MRTSTCCGANVWDDSDICSDCGEHCEVEIICKTCQGEGTIDVLDDSKSMEIRIGPPIKTITCPDCKGDGTVIENG